MSVRRLYFSRVVLVGVGLIGASLIRDLRIKKKLGSVVGFGRNQKNLLRARKEGVIDHIGKNLTKEVSKADLVILATPVSTIRELMQQIASAINSGSLVIDVGSTKSAITKCAEKYFKNGQFVPCHPIAGREKSGVEASIAGLYKGKLCVLTPGKGCKKSACLKAKGIWQEVGARVIILPAKEHDRYLARTSHLPQMIASELMTTVAKTAGSKLGDFIGSGLRDTTRIAASEPEMWAQIVLENRENLLPLLKHFKQGLMQLVSKLKNNDESGLKKYFAKARELRLAINQE